MACPLCSGLRNSVFDVHVSRASPVATNLIESHSPSHPKRCLTAGWSTLSRSSCNTEASMSCANFCSPSTYALTVQCLDCVVTLGAFSAANATQVCLTGDSATPLVVFRALAFARERCRLIPCRSSTS